MIMRVMTSGYRRLGIGLLLLLVLSGIVAGGMAFTARQPEETPLSIGKKQYAVRVVSSAADRQKGLSGSQPLNDDEGMLFVFGGNGQWGIWMKDMNYPIDILWLDENKTVVDMVENASPASYPLTTFKPDRQARYVLELAAGSIADASITVGSKATFDVDPRGSAES